MCGSVDHVDSGPTLNQSRKALIVISGTKPQKSKEMENLSTTVLKRI